MERKIEIDEHITVGALAEELLVPVSKLISELMKNGIMATVNERIDIDTAQIVTTELGLEVTLVKKQSSNTEFARQKTKSTDKNASERPPVVAVMGHVDHGKTSLLDAIRGASVVKTEAGGITQHISAYQIEHKNKKITFLDTPGHEAFASLRQHGAGATDLALIVVAADDGVKPQTVEAIRYAKNANVKIVIAINKIDKEGANPNMLKQQLADNDVLVEGWGGDTVVIEVSAKTNQGVDALLDMLFLVAEVEELKARATGPASGLIIESHMEKGRGPVAIALVEEGELSEGDFLVAGGVYAKARNLDSTDGTPIKKAGPSMPVVITGFKALPDFGDEFQVVANEKQAKNTAEKNLEEMSSNNKKSEISGNEFLRIIDRTTILQELPVIVKADVQGSLTSIVDGLKSIDNDEVAVKIVGSGVGAITESDVHTAATSNAIIIGFNVQIPNNIKKISNRDKVRVKLYSIIYELFDDVRDELQKLLLPQIVEEEQGRLVVKGIFKTTKDEIICGGEVTKGKVVMPAFARIVRDKDVLAETEIVNLKRGPQDTKEVLEGDMCGVGLKTDKKILLQEGDWLEVFTRTSVTSKL